ncbi:hypothetical protein ACFWUQ_31475 [Streptomyces sp. NPDC058662]|uniref:hypothetical protein n=1 Tax=Streptomyces sp. NPDC058662 TaxID=3346583 RepID=UPI003646A46C
MSTVIIVRPEAYRQYGSGRNHFVLVLENKFAASFRIESSSRYGEGVVVVADVGESLTQVLRSRVPAGSDVLVVSSDEGLWGAPAVEVGPSRAVAVVRVGSGALALDQARAVVESLEKADPQAIEGAQRSLVAALGGDGRALVLEDVLTSSVAKLAFPGARWSFSDPGVFTPGAVRSVSAGRERLAADSVGTVVSGQIAVKGWPLVTARSAGAGRCQELFERLSSLSHYPLVLTVEDGVVRDLKAAEAGSSQAADALRELFAVDAGHGRVFGVEFGLNRAAPQLPFNCESNAASTGKAAVSVHLVLGSVPLTEFQIVLECATSTLSWADGGAALAGAGTAVEERPRRRMNRVTAASCGCH